MKRIGLPTQQVHGFVGHLMSLGEVYAPIAKHKSFVFDRIAEPGDAVLDYQTTILPPKKLFQPTREKLFGFNRVTGAMDEAKETLTENRILLGVHNYDMKGILCLDYIMGKGNKDESWEVRRKGWTFVGVSYTPDESHFSPSVGIPANEKEGLDLFLEKVDGGYNAEALTANGEKLLAGFAGTAILAGTAPEAHFQNKILPAWQQVPGMFAKAFNHPTWEKNAKKCFSCGSCTMVCPTCYCFDVNDNLALSLKEGTRDRNWDSCQVVPFTEVAGGEVFRHHAKARVLHRVYRKFKYITDQYGKPFCVGCGRCTRACTAGISITEMVNDVARGTGA
ncbi:MAG: 4Fe-4S dicluster domain-containing protein [Myxococcota bacterium]|jgi:sulfhydrogenase subunit beta (sulfur reductase)